MLSHHLWSSCFSCLECSLFISYFLSVNTGTHANTHACVQGPLSYVYFDRSFAAVFPFLNLSRMKLEYWMAKETELFRQGRNPTCERNICVCVYVTHVSSKGHGVQWWCCYCRCYVSALSAHLSSNWRKHLIRGAPLGRQRNENSLEMTAVTKELYRSSVSNQW